MEKLKVYYSRIGVTVLEYALVGWTSNNNPTIVIPNSVNSMEVCMIGLGHSNNFNHLLSQIVLTVWRQWHYIIGQQITHSTTCYSK